MAAHRLTASLVAIAALAPAAAFAHTGIGETAGLLHGFVHPISGLDHVLAMVMVGVVAWQCGGHARWCLPASFVAIMVLGACIGMAGIGLPFVELGIALSVVVLGAVVALEAKAPVAAAMAVVAFFALFHGHAHGAEIPEAGGSFVYGVGFVLATALLHAAGLAAAALLGRIGGPAMRAAGAVASAAGLVLVAGLF